MSALYIDIASYSWKAAIIWPTMDRITRGTRIIISIVTWIWLGLNTKVIRTLEVAAADLPVVETRAWSDVGVIYMHCNVVGESAVCVGHRRISAPTLYTLNIILSKSPYDGKSDRSCRFLFYRHWEEFFSE